MEPSPLRTVLLKALCKVQMLRSKLKGHAMPQPAAHCVNASAFSSARTQEGSCQAPAMVVGLESAPAQQKQHVQVLNNLLFSHLAEESHVVGRHQKTPSKDDWGEWVYATNESTQEQPHITPIKANTYVEQQSTCTPQFATKQRSCVLTPSTLPYERCLRSPWSTPRRATMLETASMTETASGQNTPLKHAVGCVVGQLPQNITSAVLNRDQMQAAYFSTSLHSRLNLQASRQSRTQLAARIAQCLHGDPKCRLGTVCGGDISSSAPQTKAKHGLITSPTQAFEPCNRDDRSKPVNSTIAALSRLRPGTVSTPQSSRASAAAQVSSGKVAEKVKVFSAKTYLAISPWALRSPWDNLDMSCSTSRINVVMLSKEQDARWHESCKAAF